MSDYSEYYKQTWERKLATTVNEAEMFGVLKAIELLRAYGYDEAVDFLERNSDRIAGVEL